MPQQSFLLFQLPWKASTCAPALSVIDWFSFSVGKLTSGDLFWGGRGRFSVMESSELLHSLRLSPPEWNPPFPTSVPPNMQGCGNSWRKKEEGWWDRNSATLPAREWLRHFVGSHPCTFPAMHPKIFPPWLPKNSPCLPPSTNAALQRIWLRSREAKRFFFFSEICFRL